MKYDFSGYATKNDLKCSDGRTIRKDAFKHADGQIVPLVWQHMHNEATNILGHALLENREDGVYTYGVFNDTEAGQNAKKLVQHGDIKALSIYANQLKEQSGNVLHGMIREVSLVLTGANPGAFIDNLTFAHGDGEFETDATEAIIYTGLDLSLEHAEEPSSKTEKTVAEVFDTLNEEQKNVVYAMLADALGEESDDVEEEEDVEHSEGDDHSIEHSDDGGTKMKKNVFEKEEKKETAVLSHSDFEQIVKASMTSYNGSLKAAVLAHAGTYGIDNIDFLFPDAQTLAKTPDFISREMGWVSGVLAKTRKSPFSRIKSVHADITEPEARALGYIKGNLKKEEVFKLLKRVTTPTTIYKKQKLDRDDMIDITDLDVVAWMKSEMRMMLDEELARVILVGDGRDTLSTDKINEDNIRPIFSDADLYAHHVALANDIATKDLIDELVKARKEYKGSGNPVLYTTTDQLTDMLLLKDTLGRRLYPTKAELASAIMVSDIVEVPVLDGVTRVRTEDSKVMSLVGIIVNLQDYNLGADKGGQVSMFDDFDIDYNQYKYLMETRCSGALIKPKSALVIEKLPVVAG